MPKIEICSNIVTMIISAILSFVVSWLTTQNKITRENKKERFEKFYNKFYILRNKIHQGCAYNFTDLSINDQEKIMELLLETDCYQDLELFDLVYELQVNRLNNFNDLEKSCMEKCDENYNRISEIIFNNYKDYKNKEMRKKNVKTNTKITNNIQ